MTQTTEIFCCAHGTENAARPPIILIHGAGGTHLHWAPQVRQIPGQRVYAVDLPGHGQSPGVGRQSIDRYARSIVNLLDELRFSTAVIAGHSMGGAIALKMALDFPERVIGLGLVGTGARLRVAREILDGTSSDATFANTVYWINEIAFGSATDPGIRELAAQAMTKIRPSVLHGDFSACNGFDVVSRLEEISVPALVMCGTEDKMTPVKYSAYLRDHIAGARLVTFPGAGHMVMLEQPQAVVRALGEFVDSIAYLAGE